jgi:dolichol-phosphate mannosyltransferase
MEPQYTTDAKVFVVIPTYNERDNVTGLIPIILKKGRNLRVLIVDDNSPDGTAEAVESMSRRDSRISVISRPGKLGLGSAYVAGFKWVLANSNAQYIFEMDADFSHNPDRIPDFIRKIEEGNDLVIGSRYLKGVSVVNWPIRRLMLSYWASQYAGFVTGIPLRDQTSGYKCFRRQVLETIGLDWVAADGYAFQIEMNFLAHRLGFRLAETPIIFEDRCLGASKMSRKIVYEAVWVVWRLRLMAMFRRPKPCSSPAKVSDILCRTVRP